MRIIPLIAFLILTSLTYAQKKYFLILKTDDQTSVHGISFWRDVVISSPDTTIRYQLHSTPGDTIHNVPEGKYTIHIRSIFDQVVSQKIRIRNNAAAFFSLAKKNKKVSPQVLSKKIKEGDTLFILHNASGMPLSERMAITRKNGKFYASIAAIEAGNTNALHTAVSGAWTNELDEEKMTSIRQFEETIKTKNKSTGCSVIESYTVRLNGKYYSINDGTCEWAGFSKLLKTLFPEQ